MKRKPKMAAARNPFVALALMRKAGSHRKPAKAVRRAEKVETLRGFSSFGRATGFYPVGDQFDSDSPHQDFFHERNWANALMKEICLEGRDCVDQFSRG